MSWLFSQALVEEFLGGTCSDGEPSVQSNGNRTQQAFLSPGKMKEFSRLSRFGMTFKPLTEDRGKELLTLYLEDSRAKTLVLPGKGQESKEKGQECGRTWQESFAKYDQSLYSWRTPQCLLLEDSTEFLGIWPRWGSMRNGECWAQATLGLTMKEREFGLLLPTPTCHNAKEGDYPAERTRHTPSLATHVGGKIHPQFTEWMMGWPLGWTDLKPLEMDKFQEWQRQHGQSFLRGWDVNHNQRP